MQLYALIKGVRKIVRFNKVLRTMFSPFMRYGPISGHGFTSRISSGGGPDLKVLKS